MQTELANEFSRMDSEWFFPWHGLNSGREINLDRFDGRRIRLGGGPYGGSDESVYWTAIGRYLNNKINEIFELADKEIRNSGQSKVQAIVEDTAARRNVANFAPSAAAKKPEIRTLLRAAQGKVGNNWIDRRPHWGWICNIAVFLVLWRKLLPML